MVGRKVVFELLLLDGNVSFGDVGGLQVCQDLGTDDGGGAVVAFETLLVGATTAAGLTLWAPANKLKPFLENLGSCLDQHRLLLLDGRQLQQAPKLSSPVETENAMTIDGGHGQQD
jgi:hypothetical protein